MKNLRYKYNRVYYRNIFKIKLEHKWKMLRLTVAAKLVRLASTKKGGTGEVPCRDR